MFKHNIIATIVLSSLLPISLHTTDAWSRTKTASNETKDVDKKNQNLNIEKSIIESANQLPINDVASKNYAFSLKQLGAGEPLQLRGTDPTYTIPFSIPSDEVVTALKLKLNIAYSPALLSNLSHLKIFINGEIAATIALPKEQAGTNLVREVMIDPRLLADFNQINLQFIGHYTTECEDPFHSSLWLNVSNLSTLEITSTALTVQNDLALLPAPFFDRRKNKKLELPFVFGSTPSTGVLEAAGIVSSWFGALAAYRGAWFPANLNTIPADDIIIFATNDDRPAGITIPQINGPTLSIGTNPTDSKYKVLYVLGRDIKELRTAATALGLGRNTFSGDTVTITGAENLKKRQSYDAPNWIPSDRPVKLGELASLDNMNVSGLRPDLIRINFRTAPDLFSWKSKGVPIDLKYRYTPRPFIDKSTLNININKNFVTAYPLLPFGEFTGSETISKRIQSALTSEKLLPGHEDFHVPLTLMPARSQLQFNFHFDYPKLGACKDVEMRNLQASIDPDSNLDLSSFPHYLQMPNLAVFANAGYPFTKMADLSESAIILPDVPSTPDISTYLALMGRMGESTGLPAYGISVGRSTDVQKFSDKDILLLGSSSNQPLLAQWSKHMPFSINGQSRSYSLSEWTNRYLPWFETPINDRMPVIKLSEITLNKETVIVGFESPMTSGRSVVALVSDKAAGVTDALTALMDTDLISKIQGSLTVIRGKEIESMDIGSVYHIGNLPWKVKIQWLFSNNSWLVAIMLLISAILLGAVVYTLLRLRVINRTKG